MSSNLSTYARLGQYEVEKFLYGTNIKMVLYGDKSDMKKAAELAFKEMERVDKEINNHTEGGVFDRINKNAGKNKEKLKSAYDYGYETMKKEEGRLKSWLSSF